MVVCAIDRPRSAIISTRSRRLSLNRRYQRTHRMMTSRSKWRPSNSFSTLFSLPIADPQPFSPQHSRSDRAVCTRASEITAVYGDRALRLAPPIVFGDSYAQIVLRDQIFAGYPFRVYFQMDPATHRLAHVLLERRRQYATPAIFAQVGAALREQLGAASAVCGSTWDRGKPTAIDRIWRRPDQTVVASFLDFAAEILLYSNDPARRILIQYSPAGG